MKILIHFRHYPVAMGRFFDWAFRDMGHEVFSVGNYSEGKIPWGDQFNFHQYAFPPDHELPEMNYPIEKLLSEIDFKPDVIFQAADTLFLTGNSPVPNCILMTDPHVVDYTPRFEFADLVFNMQKTYLKPGQIWIPYAYYPPIHRVLPNVEKKYDVVLSGLQYPERIETVEKMKAHGLNVFNGLGVIWDEYAELYNQAYMSLCYPSKNDLPARFWEGLAMRTLVLAKRIPELESTGFVDGKHYVGFDDPEEAAKLAWYYHSHPKEAAAIAWNGWKKVKEETYYKRAQVIIKAIENI